MNKEKIDDKEKSIIDLYRNNMTQKEIANLTHTSLRDVSNTISKYRQEQERQKQKQNDSSLSSQAYALFSKGYSTLQVAIELQIRQPLADQLFNEYIKLERNHKFHQIYDKLIIDGDKGIDLFVKLAELSLAANITEDKVIKLIEIACGDLPSVESTFRTYLREIEDLNNRKQSGTIELEHILTQKAKEIGNLEYLYREAQNQQQVNRYLQNELGLLSKSIEHIKNNDEYYLKVNELIVERVGNIFKEESSVIKLAIYSVMKLLQDPSRREEFIDNVKLFSKLNENYGWYNYHDRTVKIGEIDLEGFSVYEDGHIGKIVKFIESIYTKEKEIITSSVTKEIFTNLLRYGSFPST